MIICIRPIISCQVDCPKSHKGSAAENDGNVVSETEEARECLSSHSDYNRKGTDDI